MTILRRITFQATDIEGFQIECRQCGTSIVLKMDSSYSESIRGRCYVCRSRWQSSDEIWRVSDLFEKLAYFANSGREESPTIYFILRDNRDTELSSNMKSHPS